MISPEKVRFGELDSYVVAPRNRPELAVVLCHGYGAPGHDLLGVVMEWIECLGSDASRILFVCPIAPHSLAELGMPQARAWWPLNMAALMEAIQARRFEEMHQTVPPGIADARTSLASLVRAVTQSVTRREVVAGEQAPLVLGGFSQGAMVTMDTTLRGDIPKPQMLLQFSGTVVCESAWQSAMPDRLDGVNVYQAHGTQDPILPFESAQRLRELLQDSGATARFHEFVGPHTIDSQSITDTADALKELLENLDI